MRSLVLPDSIGITRRTIAVGDDIEGCNKGARRIVKMGSIEGYGQGWRLNSGASIAEIEGFALDTVVGNGKVRKGYGGTVAESLLADAEEGYRAKYGDSGPSAEGNDTASGVCKD